MSAAGPAIRLLRVRVNLGGRIVLDDVDLNIDHGERVAIVGTNGAGKSTLLKLLAATVVASSGNVEVLGRDLRRPLSSQERRRLHAQTGQIFQGLHLVARLTVLENVLLGCLSRHGSLRTWARLFPAVEIGNARELLSTVGLGDSNLMRADQLSGGERQKVAIARMLQQRPQLILSDEPTSAVDPAASIAMAQLISAQARVLGATIITVVHEPDLLPLVADRVIGLNGGRLAFDLPVASVTQAVLGTLYGGSGRGTAPASDSYIDFSTEETQ